MGTMASMRWTRAVSILAILLLLAANAFALLGRGQWIPDISVGCHAGAGSCRAGRDPGSARAERCWWTRCCRGGPTAAGSNAGKPGRCRDRQLSGDAPGKGSAGRFPDGRYQRLWRCPGRGSRAGRSRRMQGRPAGALHDQSGACRDRRDRRCRSPPAIRRTSTGWSARSAGPRPSRACLSTVAGRRIW